MAKKRKTGQSSKAAKKSKTQVAKSKNGLSSGAKKLKLKHGFGEIGLVDFTNPKLDSPIGVYASAWTKHTHT